MTSPDRLSGLDTSFLHLERGGAHMHVGSCMVFEGPTPSHEDLLRHVESRLDLVPRYRQKIMDVPFRQGRPVWVDDPHFNLPYHVRISALPSPGESADLSRLCGRLFATGLDRNKPLWEIIMVEGLSGDRFALIAKTHHALVDGVSGVDLATVLFDLEKSPSRPAAPPAWSARPLPTSAQLLGDALVERSTVPAEMIRSARAAARRPRRALETAVARVSSLTALAAEGTEAPPSPLNVKIGAHRRFVWLESDLQTFKDIKNGLGGTLNDAVLATVAGGLGAFLRSRGEVTRGLELRAMVPVSVRPDSDRGALGNQVAVMWASLPVGETDPKRRLRRISESMAQVKESGQAVGAQTLTELSGFAPQTILAQAARLVPRQRFFNLVVTNVPGPQFPLWLLGRQLIDVYPMAPLAQQQALCIAVMSYNGRLDFGLNADWDALPDVDLLIEDLRASLEELHRAALKKGGKSSKSAPPSSAAKMRA